MLFCFRLDPFQDDCLFLGWHFRRRMKWLQERMRKVKRMDEKCNLRVVAKGTTALVLCPIYLFGGRGKPQLSVFLLSQYL